MPVAIDEVSAEIAAPPAESAAAGAGAEAHPTPEKLLRQQQELLEHLARRAARVHAD